jgi:hypothetical protein
MVLQAVKMTSDAVFWAFELMWIGISIMWIYIAYRWWRQGKELEKLMNQGTELETLIKMVEGDKNG